MTRKPKVSTLVITAICIILSAAYIAACFLLHKFDEVGGSAALSSYILTFAVFILVFFLVTKRDKEPVESDERTRSITDRAYTYSWLLTYIALVIFTTVDFLFPLNLGMRGFSYIVMLIMALSAIILRAIMMRKGNVE
jgi:hypothetical protein